MKRILSITLFIIAAVFNLNAQSETDTLQPEVIGKVSQGALMLYINGGTSFALGGYVPQTYQEFEIGTNGQPSNGLTTGTGITRTGVSYNAGGCYGIGLEFLPTSSTPYFNIIDIGIAGYSFGGNVYDDIYTYNVTSSSNNIISNSTVANPYTYTYGMVELGIYQFYRFMKKGNKRLSVGLGARVTYVFSESDPDYYRGDESTSPTIGFLFSTRLRLKGKLNSLDMFINWGGSSGLTNAYASAGLQYAFSLTPQ